MQSIPESSASGQSGQTTIEEAADDNILIKRKQLESLQQMTKYVPLLNPMQAKIKEKDKLIIQQNSDIVRLSNSLVELSRRNEDLEKQLTGISGIKELKIKLDTTDLSMWTMGKTAKFRNIELTYHLEEKKITGFEYII